MTMELVNGRPADCAGRLEKEIRCYDLLDSLGIDYQRIDHEAAMTMEACEEIDRVLDAVICKNLLLCNRQCTEFYLLMLPGDKHFKTSVLSKEIGSSRLSFSSAMSRRSSMETESSLSAIAAVLKPRRFSCSIPSPGQSPITVHGI